MNRHYQEGLPLSSYWALDVTDHMGLFCGQILAGLGAEVIRVDRPEPGRMRSREATIYFDCYNMGKKSITLNIEHLRGQEIFRKVAGNVDIVIESMPPGHMEALGLGYAALREINPKIIMTSITAFGQKGPYSRYKACDLTMMALGAFMVQDGDPDRSPLRIGVPQSYVLAGAHAAWGTMLALYHRHTSGEGQHVDVSARDCVVASNLVMAQRSEFASGISERHGQWVSRMGVKYRHIWPCRDGYVSFRIFPGAMGGPMVHRMVEWMDSEGLAGSLKGVDWTSVDIFQVSQEQMDDWEETIAGFMLKHTRAELDAEAATRGIWLGSVSSPPDIMANRQLKARRYFSEVEYSEKHTVTFLGAPFKSNEVSWKTGLRAPCIGEHNRDIYINEIGLSEEEFSQLKEAGII